MADNNSENEVNYKLVSEDPNRACLKCKHFKPKEGDLGECFGHEVSAKGTCNFFEAKKEE